MIDALESLFQERAWQFQSHWPGIFRSDAGLFKEKALCYPGAHFAVGIDTAHRILDPKYYSSMHELQNVLRSFRSTETKIYVFHREGSDNQSLAFQNPNFSKEVQEIFVSLPGSWNISSSHLRSECE
ncbi:MAG: hypothetical protein IPL87_01205 [Candidatus Moraniibacteriota bacterium]|nr:MAG: hypothetical protein IPL87_01205 [Candidatus Moranbacteria bacterium]